MNRRETGNVIEVRFFAVNLFVYILSIFLKLYRLQFDRDLTFKYPLRKMYAKTVDMVSRKVIDQLTKDINQNL